MQLATSNTALQKIGIGKGCKIFEISKNNLKILGASYILKTKKDPPEICASLE